MTEIPGHLLPEYSHESRDDSLFHYTTASGLVGILSTGQIRGTAYYCANDESELASGKGVLQPLFRVVTEELIRAKDDRVQTFWKRGVDVRQYAEHFEQQIVGMALSRLCAFITCFCKPTSKEDFYHGLLSQWRGYGENGGYALHFSRKKLVAAIEHANKSEGLDYKLQDVHYTVNNSLRESVLVHRDAFVSAYLEHLDELADPQVFSKKTMRNPIAGLPGGPLEALLDYLVHTKNQHFGEERECRLSLIQLVSPVAGSLPAQYFDRRGMLVPFVNTPKPSFNVIDCLEWIIVGPGPRMGSRFKSASHLARQLGQEVKVRASYIPYTRL